MPFLGFSIQNANQKYSGSFVAVLTYPLDNINGIVAAYSINPLYASYSGRLMRVRNASNVYADIGIVNKQRDLTSIVANAAGGKSYIYNLDDQSGNNHLITQSTTSYQPCIADAGAYLGYIKLEPWNPRLTISDLENTNFPQDEFSIFIKHYKNTDSTQQQQILNWYTTAYNEFFVYNVANNKYFFALGNSATNGTINSFNSNSYDNGFHTLGCTVKHGGAVKYYVDGVNCYSQTIQNLNWYPNTQKLLISATNYGNANLLHSFIIFNRVLTDSEFQILHSRISQ